MYFNINVCKFHISQYPEMMHSNKIRTWGTADVFKITALLHILWLKQVTTGRPSFIMRWYETKIIFTWLQTCNYFFLSSFLHILFLLVNFKFCFQFKYRLILISCYFNIYFCKLLISRYPEMVCPMRIKLEIQLMR